MATRVNKTFSLLLDSEVSLDEAWELLQHNGIEVLYSEEEKGSRRLIVKTSLVPIFPFIRSCQEIVLPEIDWEAEWTLHAPGFADGKLPLDLRNGKVLYLVPGAGFGDLSHPTTRLTLELMKGNVEGKDVIDIGSGSGVLSIAAAALGARSVIGIDIDSQANEHARQNALLNGFPDIKFYLPKELPALNRSYVFLMNMITSEQQEAWKPFLHMKGIAITSGVLKEQEEEYRALVSAWGWKVENVVEEEGWLGFRFNMNFLPSAPFVR